MITPAFAEWLPLDEVTIAELLQTAGYTTGHFGKWHLNRDKDYAPGRKGEPGSQGFDVVLTTHKSGSGPESPLPDDPLHAKQITRAALEFIDSNRSNPFFCYLSFNSIHRPEVASEAVVERFRAKRGADNEAEYGHNNPRQAAMLYELDASVGQILDRLDDLGLSESSLVVFFSDNGHLGPKDSDPLRGSKGDLYEGGIRSPMLVRWPSTTPAGTVSSEMVISNDFFLTFSKLAGLKRLPENVDGVDLTKVYTDPNATLERESLFFHFPHYHSLGLGPMGAIREGDLKLIEWHEKALLQMPDAYELYDMKTDRGERNNLADAQPQTVARLKRKLSEWRRSVGAQEMETRQ